MIKPTEEMVNRVVAEALGYHAALRWCMADPECGGWMEHESLCEGEYARNLPEKETDNYQRRVCIGTPYPDDDGFSWDVAPDYCTDRNALPQLWEHLLKADDCHDFIYHLQMTIDKLCVYPHKSITWMCIASSCRWQCIAFLKALKKWPADWETEIAEEE